MRHVIENAVDLVEREAESLKFFLNLTANENVLSRTAQYSFGTDICNRYLLGLPELHTSDFIRDGDFILKGLPCISQLEREATKLFNNRLSVAFSDFRLLSGVHANICTIASMSDVGDTILSIHPEDGGHFATSNMVTRMGRKSCLVRFSKETCTVSLEELESQVKKYRPRMFLIDHSATLFPFPLGKIRKIVGNECLLVYDASHVLGLIYGGCFQDPIKEGCDVIQGNTHKTFPGPQKAVVGFASEDLGRKVAKVVEEGFVSSQHTHHSVALYNTIMEMEVYGQEYARKIIDNARLFSCALLNNGFDVFLNNGVATSTHMFFVRIPKKMSSVEAWHRLYDVKLSTNVKKVYGEELLRIGVQEITRIGLGRECIERLAQIARCVLIEGESPSKYVNEVEGIRKAHREILYSFDV